MPGPPEKVYSQPNAGKGYVPHSMVGRLQGWYSRLFDMSRHPDGSFTANAAASVHGSVLLDGTLIQHYPLTASCWASGSRAANTLFVSFEHESVYNNGQPDETKPFTPEQVQADVRIIRELMAWRGWRPRRPTDAQDRAATLYEHREMTRFGSPPTSCPSGRVPWDAILAALEDAQMTPQERHEFDALKAQVTKLAADLAVAKVFFAIGAKALNGEPAPDQEKAEARALLS